MTSDTLIGVAAVIGAWITFGSFGVFIKTPAVVKANVDPLVFQTYKTAAVFLSSWLVLLYRPFYFSYWGIIGAIIWVPAGAGAVTAVRYAGLGVSQGIWSGISVLGSFAWGAFVFGNTVASWPLSILALLLIVTGTTGMAWASQASPPAAPSKPPATAITKGTAVDHGVAIVPSHNTHTGASGSTAAVAMGSNSTGKQHVEQDQLLQGSKASQGSQMSPRKRLTIGLVAAVLTGLVAGTMYVPLHYAGSQAHSAEYLVSFGVGAVIMNAAFLAVYYGARFATGKPLPAFHFRITWAPGLATGILWALGNYFSIYATLYLTQAIGATLSNVSLLVAGAWGIFWYKEIRTTTYIASWFAFAGCTIGGAVLLVLFG